MFVPHSSRPPIVHPCDPKAYHSADSFARGNPSKTMSQSELKEFSRCQRRWLNGFKEESSDAMEDGALLDCLILTPERFGTSYAITPETYPSEKGDKPWNWNANHCKAWRDEQEAAGFEVVKPSAASDAHAAKAVFYKNEHIAEFHAVSQKQVCVNVEWMDEETGLSIPIKCLLDLAPDPDSEFGDTLADLKRTNNAEYRAWCATVRKFQLHYQAAFYLDAINAATGLKYRNFEHHIQESFSPWETTHRMLSAEFVNLGRVAYMRDLQDYCRALKSGVFRGYDEAIVEPEAWMLA